MTIENIIQPDRVLCNATARSKKHCLEILSELLVRSIPDIANEVIFENLIDWAARAWRKASHFRTVVSMVSTKARLRSSSFRSRLISMQPMASRLISCLA